MNTERKKYLENILISKLNTSNKRKTDKRVIEVIKEVYSFELNNIDVLYNNDKEVKKELNKLLDNIEENFFFIGYIRELANKRKVKLF